jgi:hypothetical protein
MPPVPIGMRSPPVEASLDLLRRYPSGTSALQHTMNANYWLNAIALNDALTVTFSRNPDGFSLYFFIALVNCPAEKKPEGPSHRGGIR